MKFRIYIILISVLFGNQVLSGRDIHSTLSEIDQLPKDTARVNRLLELYVNDYLRYTDSAGSGSRILLEALDIAQKIQYEDGIIAASFRLGQCYNFSRKRDLAITYFFNCIRRAEKKQQLYYKYYSLLNLGLIHYNQRKWKTALSYFNQTRKVDPKLKGKIYLEHTSEYLAGLCNLEIGELDLAEKDIQRALTFAKSEHDSDRIHECLIGIGRIMLKRGYTDDAIEIFNTCLQYPGWKKEHVALALIYEQLSGIYEKKGKLQDALKYALLAYSECKATSAALNMIETTGRLQRLYAAKGDIQSAYKYLLESNNLKDSISISDISTEILMAQVNYEFEKKELNFHHQIEEKERKKNFALWLSGIAALILLITVFALILVRRERKKSEKLLLNILPRETAAELKKLGKAIPRKHESVTVMFCDVKQFTLVSEHLSPETLVAMLDIYISKFDEIISNLGLEKIKTIGDAYMCAGGLHSGTENHAETTVKAAIQILDFVEASSDNMKKAFGETFVFRIGIHTGPLVSGVVGSHKYAYDVWGDTVNIAARMEEKSEPGQINISGVTCSLLTDNINATYRGMIESKNKAPMEMYFVNR